MNKDIQNIDRRIRIDRRHRMDIWVIILRFFNISAWALIATILIIFERARPQFESFFDRFYKLKLRVDWDPAFVDYLLWIVITGIVISASGLLLSRIRTRRKYDWNNVSLLIMGLLSLGFLVGMELFLL